MAAESGFELPTDYYANQRLAQWNGSRGTDPLSCQ
ncbi:hypothetical protein BH18ACI4_BH18ACI4_16260 [soil metagenome]